MRTAFLILTAKGVATAGWTASTEAGELCNACAAPQFASLGTAQFCLTKTLGDEVHVFVENETLWRRSMTADCNFPALLSGRLAGGFESVICQSLRLAERAIYLRSLISLGRR